MHGGPRRRDGRAWPWILASVLAWSCGGNGPDPVNLPPAILDLRALPPGAVLRGTIEVSAFVTDPERAPLTPRWSGDGIFQDPGAFRTEWTAPDTPGPARVIFQVTDDAFTVRDTLFIEVGNARLRVTSDPPGARIVLDGVDTDRVTPHLFDPIAPGPAEVSLVNPAFTYTRSLIDVDLVHGESDSIGFEHRDAVRILVDLGRTDLQEIGSLAVLPSGAGFLYSARTDSGIGLYSSGVNVPRGSPNGVLLVSGVALAEPVAVTGDGDSVLYVTGSGDLVPARLLDPEEDGVINGLDPGSPLSGAWGPALSRTSRIAFTGFPSDDPPSGAVLWGRIDPIFGNLEPREAASTLAGRLPSWRPGSSQELVFDAGGNLALTDGVGTGGLATRSWITAGYATAPDWGPWGPGHVAFLTGAPGMLDAVDLAVAGEEVRVRIHEGLSDARAVRWNPQQKTLLVAHNPGRAEVVFLVELPIP